MKPHERCAWCHEFADHAMSHAGHPVPEWVVGVGLNAIVITAIFLFVWLVK